MKKKYKITYLVSRLQYCGPINILYSIINSIDKELFDITIITLSKNHEQAVTDFENLGAKIISIKGGKKDLIFSFGKNVIRVINEINPDIIHSHGFWSDYCCSKLKRNTFSTIHNYPHLDYRMQYGFLLGKIMSYFQIKFLFKIKNPISCSYAVANELDNNYGLKTIVIQNGINVQKFNLENAIHKNNLKLKYNIPMEKKVIISVGNLQKRKNPLFLIDEFLHSQIKDDYTLLFLGDGELLEECKERAKKYKNIKFLGKVNNVKDYLLLADIFISCSKAEGMPNAVLEAMACGLPVILSDIAPHREIISHQNEQIGWIFNLEENNLTLILNNLSEYELNKLGDNARKIVRNSFSSTTMSIKYQDIYLQKIQD